MTSTSVLFVCLGNICRSPMAEGLFRHKVEALGLGADFRIDSAGTGSWHIGKPPDSRAIAAIAELGIDISGQRARRVTALDLETFDHVIAMDRQNLDDLMTLSDRSGAVLRLLLDLAPDAGAKAGSRAGTRDVPDPYLDDGFGHALELIEAGTQGLLDDLLKSPSQHKQH